MIKVTHNAGFFSCCSVRVTDIVKFMNLNKKLPDSVDSSQQFELYKNDKNKDVTFDYFENYININDVNIIYPINYNHDNQFKPYSELDYKSVSPLIKKYFSPSVKINEMIDHIKNKYNIVYDNTVAVYYRGSDKYTETKISPFDDFYKKILEIVNINKDIKILLQTDTSQFIDYIKKKKLNNIIIMDENKPSYNSRGIHNERSCDTNYNEMFHFLSMVIIISKCKYIICSSGNCSIWMMYYRENATNVMQFLDGKCHSSLTH
jgi:hypothetical protein